MREYYERVNLRHKGQMTVSQRLWKHEFLVDFTTNSRV